VIAPERRRAQRHAPHGALQEDHLRAEGQQVADDGRGAEGIAAGPAAPGLPAEVVEVPLQRGRVGNLRRQQRGEGGSPLARRSSAVS